MAGDDVSDIFTGGDNMEPTLLASCPKVVLVPSKTPMFV